MTLCKIWLSYVVISKFIMYVPGCIAYNLGTGRGTSVLEMVAAFEKASGKVTIDVLSVNHTIRRE